MDVLSIVLLLLAAGGMAAAVALGLSRARLTAQLAGAEEEKQAIRQRAEADVARLAGDLQGERQQAQAAIAGLQERIEQLRGQMAKAEAEVVTLVERSAAAEGLHRAELLKREEIYRERQAALEQQKQMLETELRQKLEEVSTRFDALAGKALKAANEEFFKRTEALVASERQKAAAEIEVKRAAVDQLLKPISETLEKTGLKLAEIDKARLETASQLGEHLRALSEGNIQLREETGRLVKALREPHVRGRYGEMQLRRVAELAGMQAYCDFTEQDCTTDGDGNPLRPDMVVRLPNERVVVVDAKTNIQAYLDALQARDPDEAEVCLDRFAKHVSDQAGALARKKYWSQYDGSPEFVVMFIPGDHFIDAALARQPDLLDLAARQKVLLAGPATLISLLRAVAVGYQEQRLARDAAELRSLGVELHERASVAFGYAAELGTMIERLTKKYNDFVGSYQSRLEPTLRKFESAGARSGKDLPQVESIETRPRLIAPVHPVAEPEIAG
jgi:DNA recombination protein RmuC